MDLLFLDQPRGVARNGAAEPLQNQVEAIVLGFRDAVVIDRGAQVLARARRETQQRQRAATGRRQRDRRRPSTIGDAHDDRPPTAVLEELLDRIGQRGGLPETTEHPLVLGEALDDAGFVDRPLQRAPDEGSDPGRRPCDGALRTRRRQCFGKFLGGERFYHDGLWLTWRGI